MFNNIYRGRKILITGHTGFKGSWLALWLKSLGADVVGISLAPTSIPNHWDLLNLGIESIYLDIRDEPTLRKLFLDLQPEMVFHLAAQPLVRQSYKNPLETWSTNVMGTANVLNICRELSNLEAVVVITTDKCYENKEWEWGYREIDPLGGHDPYSASKAGSELVATSFRKSFFNSPKSPLIATARAGNVIGGGDWSEDRLIPDLVRALDTGAPLTIRSPKATRPWQHVLECLSGYLLVGQKLLEGDQSVATAWNFGPGPEGNRTVLEVLNALKRNDLDVRWELDSTQQPHEAQLLHLDTGKAREKLGWSPVWGFDEGVKATADWYSSWQNQRAITSSEQLVEFVEKASKRGFAWANKADGI
jgi:CDP-glucose 4,6-dehydratase